MAGRCDFEGKHSDFLRRPLREQLEEGSFGISGGLAVVYSYPELVRSAASRICGRQLARDKRRRRSSARGGEARRRRKRLRENGGRHGGFFCLPSCATVPHHITVIHQYDHQWHRWHGRHGPWCKRTQATNDTRHRIRVLLRPRAQGPDGAGGGHGEVCQCASS